MKIEKEYLIRYREKDHYTGVKQQFVKGTAKKEKEVKELRELKKYKIQVFRLVKLYDNEFEL